MNHIKSLSIQGFKKFQNFKINFNEHVNILVGENAAGKSTILEAIKLVLNQEYKHSDKSALKDLFNQENIKNFEKNPSKETLPKISIELEFNLDPSSKYAKDYYGEDNVNKRVRKEGYGIYFECSYDEDLDPEAEQSISEKKIPLEYYTLKWKTFGGQPYQTTKHPLNFIFINTSERSSGSIFNYYNKTLFISRYDELDKIRSKNAFRQKLEEIFKELNLKPLSENREFAIDTRKVTLENVLYILENSIPLENQGSGMESLIKTQIALDKTNNLNLILLEEPENHLSPSSLDKMLSEIITNKENSQIIITTHSNTIASRLDLRRVIWINNDQTYSLDNIDEKVAAYFMKLPSNSFLELLLSNKLFLVEGASEYLLLPRFYKQITGEDFASSGISIISCNGLTYKYYLEIIKHTKKQVAVITDNDEDEDKILESNEFNQKSNNQRIFMPKSVEDWTFEVALYNIEQNKQTLSQIIKLKQGCAYKYRKKELPPLLGKMLNDKVETSYSILQSQTDMALPEYIKDAIEWLAK